MASKKNRSIVGYPLTPDILGELGALGPISATRFSPAGNWTNVYRIWACHGYRESGNEDKGTLKIERSSSSTNDTFSLKVVQTIENDRDLVHALDAEIVCRNDTLATPIQWQSKSTFYDPGGLAVPDLCTAQSGRVRDNTAEIMTKGKTRQYESSRPLTGDWCLCEAVQRMPWKDSTRFKMDILKEMALPLKDHQLVYDDKRTFVVGGKPIDLYHFQQLGRGMLPFDYWLDAQHRLQIFVTLSIAYIRDDRAERQTA
jgi:hypothetical protein